MKQSNTNFQAISSQDQALSKGISLLPGALKQTSSTLGKVQEFASVSGPALKQLQPFARDLGPALKALQPLAKETTPVIEKQLVPFATNPGIHRLAATLAPAASSLAKAAPALSGSFSVLNKLVNTLAYQKPGGRAELPVLGRLARSQPRQPDDAAGRRRPDHPGPVPGQLPVAEPPGGGAAAGHAVTHPDPRHVERARLVEDHELLRQVRLRP